MLPPAKPTRRRTCTHLSINAAQSMSASLRKRPKCCVASNSHIPFTSSIDDPLDVDHDVPRSAEYLVMPVRRRINHESRVLYSANEFVDSNLSLQPRERAAETEVDAAAVSKVLVVLAFEVDLVRVREPFRVAVARSIQHNDRRALWNGRSRNLDVFEGGAGGPKLDRRFETQELLDPRHNQLRSAAQLVKSIVVPQQREHTVGDQVDGGLVTGEKQKHRVAQELAVRQTLFGAIVHHRGEHARAGLFGVLFQQPVHIVSQFLFTPITHLAKTLLLLGSCLRAQVETVHERLDPTMEARLVLPWHA